LLKNWSNNIYEDPVIFSKQTKYQKIIITKYKNDLRLFLNGNLQFSSKDEYRYHEALVHIPLSLFPQKQTVLVLGGGDGLAIREILKYPEVQKIILVDLDPEIVKLAREHYHLKTLNQNSLKHKKVQVINQDAFVFLKESDELYDVIIADLPDPNNVSLARLYSREFYNIVLRRLSKSGVFVTQSTSPFFAKKAFWCIYNTMKEAGFKTTVPYHAYIPSFGDWGFIMGSNISIRRAPPLKIPGPTKFIDERNFETLFTFDKDILDQAVQYSTLDAPAVLHYYLDAWRTWE